MPSDFPIRTVFAMRVLSGLPIDKIPQSAHTLFKAYWCVNQDIADQEIVSKLINSDSVERANL